MLRAIFDEDKVSESWRPEEYHLNKGLSDLGMISCESLCVCLCLYEFGVVVMWCGAVHICRCVLRAIFDDDKLSESWRLVEHHFNKGLSYLCMIYICVCVRAVLGMMWSCMMRIWRFCVLRVD